MLFEDIIRGIRLQLNMTQEQLARELNISFSTINRWENGHTTPSRLAKMRLLDYCCKKDIDAAITSEIEKL
jgi:putative transcriptional regulator